MHGFAVLVNGLGLMALMAALFGVLIRAPVGLPLREVALGAMFGLCAALPGIMPEAAGTDPQVMLIGFAAAFLGLGGLAAAVGFALVLHALPVGPVPAPQAAALLAAACGGLVWSILVPARWQVMPAGHALLGLVVAGGAAVAGLGAGGAPVAAGALAGSAVLGVVLALAMGSMVARERAQVRREARLAREARTDPLTGLPNRRALVERHAAACADWPAPGVAVMIVDLDRFKAVNDTHGHSAGDAVLSAAAARIRAVCADPGWDGRPWAARLGGEEFAVHVGATSRREATALAEALRGALAAAPVALPAGVALPLTGSIGVAWSDTPRALTTMLEAADAALYDAKRGGRNGVRVAAAIPPGTPAEAPAAVPGRPAHAAA
jgi:diguanylate cyclase